MRPLLRWVLGAIGGFLLILGLASVFRIVEFLLPYLP